MNNQKRGRKPRTEALSYTSIGFTASMRNAIETFLHAEQAATGYEITFADAVRRLVHEGLVKFAADVKAD